MRAYSNDCSEKINPFFTQMPVRDEGLKIVGGCGFGGVGERPELAECSGT